MTSEARTTKLWDFGWIRHDTVTLPEAATDEELIRHYCASPFFHLSFLPSDKDETGLHGPFSAARILPEDFEPLAKPDLPQNVETIQIANDPADDTTAQAIILKTLQESFVLSDHCFALKYTEKSEEMFHGWGSVFSVFREFLLPVPASGKMERIAVGYD